MKSANTDNNSQGEDIKVEKQYKDILKYTGLFGGVQGLNMLASLVRNKLTALILGTFGYGFISIYNSAVTLLNNSTNFGISFSSVKNLSQINAENDTAKTIAYINTIRFWGILASLFGMIVCFVIAGKLSQITFESDQYTGAFRALSIVVGLTTFSTVELSILKALRRLADVARVSMLTTIGSLIVVPIYYFAGVSGIVPALIAISVMVTGITLYYTSKIYGLNKEIFLKNNFKKGIPLFKLGTAFIIAGVFTSGAEYLIRTFIARSGSIDDVGLYNAGYAVSVTYMGMIFKAMENDFFPKLSAIGNKLKERNVYINNQIEIALWLISPMVALLLLFMPVILPLLYSGKFLPAQDMILWTTIFMFFKALVLPVSYLTLAKGDSRAFMLLEFISAVIFVSAAVFLYKYYALMGLGLSLAISGVFDLLIIGVFANRKYGFKYTLRTFKTAALLLPLLLIMVLLFYYERNIYTWLTGSVLTLIICSASLYYLNRRTSFINSIRTKFKI